MKIKAFDEIKHLSGYIGIHSKIDIDRSNSEFVNSDILFTELARVSKPLYLNNDNIPCYQLIHLGGAFLSNEKYLTDILVDSGAWIIVTSQAANKVNATKKDDDPSTYNLNIELEQNSILEFINDALILYPKAKYNQFVSIKMKDNSSLIYTDIISPGYSPTNNIHQYDEMFVCLEIFINEKLVLYDKLNFTPHSTNPTQLAIMNNYDRCGTMILINEKFNTNLCNELNELINDQKFEFKFEIGISCFSKNCIGIRLLANQTYEIEKIFNLIHNFIRVSYLNKLPLNLRKQP